MGKVGVIFLFDVLLHQVRPDWDEILDLYALRTDSFAIYNQQWTGDGGVIDTIWRLESEVLGRRVTTGKRQCAVRLPEPIELSQYLQIAGKDRRAAVARLTSEVKLSIQRMLDEESSKPTS